MCGRFTLSVDISKVAAAFYALGAPEIFQYPKRYNIAPTQDVPVIIGKENREITLMRWGLVPHWSKDLAIGNKLMNARAETIDQKPAFRSSFRYRRCLIPTDGFYEWKHTNKKKAPYRITLPNKDLFAFAGIWALWSSPEGFDVHSCSIITTDANDFVRGIHDRMPVIFSSDEEYTTWLKDNDTAILKSLLKPYQGPMTAHEVSADVNSPRNDNPHIMKKYSNSIL